MALHRSTLTKTLVAGPVGPVNRVAVGWGVADSGGMGFFDELPADEPESPARHRPWDLPNAEIPGIVPIQTLMLGRTDQVAVAVTGISAYAEGFEIFVTGRLRPPGATGDREYRPDRGMIRRSLRFGLLLSDGRKVFGEYGHDTEPTGPILRAYMTGGALQSHFSRWWAWPLPPAGPLAFVCEWHGPGVPETRAVIDAQLILDAAAHSTRLWPENGG
jgi:hypothetical protein